MKKPRTKKHPEYFAIPAYQTLARKTDEEVAKELGISVRSYKDKIKGYSDFKQGEANVLSKVLQRSADDLFLT